MSSQHFISKLTPLLGYDGIYSEKAEVELVLDLDMSTAEINQFNTQTDKPWEMTIMGAVLMVFGGSNQCLTSMGEATIGIKDEYRPFSLGYEDKESMLKQVVIIMFMVIFLLLILIVSYTVYKSFTQKQIRLELLRVKENVIRTQEVIKALSNDRQVIMALSYVNQ